MARTRTATRSPELIAYVRVSTSEQADSGAGLQAQRSAIRAECQRRGLVLSHIYEDAGISAKNMDRPALAEALRVLDAGQAAGLMVAKVDRLSRSLVDFAMLMARAAENGWAIIALDLGVDTTTPSGEFMANVVASVAQYERRLVSQRTRDALAAKRTAGVRLGRPRLLDPQVAERIRSERASGATLQAIAQRLNDDGITTPTRKRWSPVLVRKVALQQPPAGASRR